jgi:hypothetical protein
MGALNDFMDDPNDFMDDPNDFMDDPNDFMGDPNDFMDDPNDFMDDPNDFMDDPNGDIQRTEGARHCEGAGRSNPGIPHTRKYWIASYLAMTTHTLARTEPFRRMGGCNGFGNDPGGLAGDPGGDVRGCKGDCVDGEHGSIKFQEVAEQSFVRKKLLL